MESDESVLWSDHNMVNGAVRRSSLPSIAGSVDCEAPFLTGSWFKFGILLTAAFGLRAVLLGLLGPGRDEVAYWYWSWHHLDASYSALTLGAIRLATGLGGDAVFWVRFPSFVAGILSVFLLVKWMGSLGGSTQAKAWGALLLAVTPWQGYVGSVAHPDAFLTAFTLGFAWSAERCLAERRRKGQWLCIASCFAAAAALSKLTGVLVLGAAAVLLARAGMRAPRAAGISALILGAAAAALALHFDASLTRALRSFGTFAPDLPWSAKFASLGAEFLVLAGPALLFVGGNGLRRKLTRSPLHWSPGELLGASWIAAFTMAYLLWGSAKANWFLPGLLLLVPREVIREADGDGSKFGRRLPGFVAGSAVLSVTLAFLVCLPRFPRIWQNIRSSPALASWDATYAIHAGDREREVSPTTSWTDRFLEFSDDRPVDPRVRTSLDQGLRTFVSDDYGLAFEIAFRTGRDARVVLPWDPVFASTCGWPTRSEMAGWPGTSVPAALFVSRRPPPREELRARFDSLEVVAPPGAGREGSGPEFAPLHVVGCFGYRGGP